MSRRILNLALLCCCMLIFSSASAQTNLFFSAQSPQDVGGVLPVDENFTIDIWIDNIAENDYCGGSFNFCFYSPDQSATTLEHVAVTGGEGPLGSIEFLNGWNDMFAFFNEVYGWSWDESLPDTVSFTNIGATCMTPDLPDQAYIRFNLRTSQEGTLCVDSIDHPDPSGDHDWLFAEYMTVEFNGPYCWQLEGICIDSDGDGYGDPGHPENTCPDDNCPTVANQDQADADEDGIGDACDECTDTDGDGLGNPGYAANTCPEDNCPDTPNPNQEDIDNDGIGLACDDCVDTDDDGAGNPGYAQNTCPDDNCPDTPNPNQEDTDNDGIGDECDTCTDTDLDGYGNPGFAANTCPDDNCPDFANPNQADADGDGIGDVCDPCTDTDGDGYGDPGYFATTCQIDNCPDTYNPGQEDVDQDGTGDVCDPAEVLFSADILCGGAPLMVQFTDESVPTASITSWFWDFGDGSTSTDQNPMHEFTQVGTFDIMLIVSDGSNSDTLRKNDYISTQEGIVVDFQANPRRGTAPLTVMFDPNIAGNVTSWFWDFGDGNTSTEENPIHTYTDQGIYNVELQAYLLQDGCDQSDVLIKQGYITVSELDAQFSGTPRIGEEPLVVQFTDASPGSPTTWLWDFGDGNTSDQQNPQHTYVQGGEYDVSLTVEDGLGFTDDILKLGYISVQTDYTDLAVEAFIWGDFGGLRPGFNYGYAVTYPNLAAITAANSELKILFPPTTQFNGVSSVFDNYTINDIPYYFNGDTIIIDLGDVPTSSYWENYVWVYGYIPTSVPIGDFLDFCAIVTTTTADADYDNNVLCLTSEVGGSIDPNDKLASPGDDKANFDIVPGQRLTYTVQFENKPEATLPAVYVLVVDTLDPDLNWSTLTFDYSSHPGPCSHEFDPHTGVITWFCDEIMLPPNNNPPEGEGYFIYSITPKKNLPELTEISNAAYIRFDYNEWLQAPEAGPIIRTIKTPYICGDLNDDLTTNILDIIFFIEYKYKGGPEPSELIAANVNCDNNIDILDIVYYINKVFKGGPDLNCCPLPLPALAKTGDRTRNIYENAVEATLNRYHDKGRTYVSVNSPRALAGLELNLRYSGETVPELINKTEGMQIYYSHNGDNIKIGLLDINGDAFIKPGGAAVLEISGEVEITEATGAVDGSTPVIFEFAAKPEEAIGLPDNFALEQNYPNPFNPETNIKFSLPQAVDVRLNIYNVLGQKVTTLVDEHMEAGYYNITWDGTNTDGTPVASGIYFYRIKAGAFDESRKMMLLK